MSDGSYTRSMLSLHPAARITPPLARAPRHASINRTPHLSHTRPAREPSRQLSPPSLHLPSIPTPPSTGPPPLPPPRDPRFSLTEHLPHPPPDTEQNAEPIGSNSLFSRSSPQPTHPTRPSSLQRPSRSPAPTPSGPPLGHLTPPPPRPTFFPTPPPDLPRTLSETPRLFRDLTPALSRRGPRQRHPPPPTTPSHQPACPQHPPPTQFASVRSSPTLPLAYLPIPLPPHPAPTSLLSSLSSAPRRTSPPDAQPPHHPPSRPHNTSPLPEPLPGADYRHNNPPPPHSKRDSAPI